MYASEFLSVSCMFCVSELVSQSASRVFCVIELVSQSVSRVFCVNELATFCMYVSESVSCVFSWNPPLSPATFCVYVSESVCESSVLCERVSKSRDVLCECQ